MSKEYVKIIVAICLLAISAYAGHSFTENLWQARWSERDASDAKAIQVVTDQYRKAEQDLSELRSKIDEEHAKKSTEIDTAVANAVGLQQQIHDAAMSRAAANSCSIAERANAATDATVLANVLGRIDRRAGEVAEIAERWRLAGEACQAEYEAARYAVSVKM